MPRSCRPSRMKEAFMPYGPGALGVRLLQNGSCDRTWSARCGRCAVWPSTRLRPHNDGMTGSVVAPEAGRRGEPARLGAARSAELVALAGENGAGKTTLVRCIAGEVSPASGEVFFAGRRMPPDQAAAIKQGIAVVWQDLALCDNLDVAANIMLGRERPRLLMSETRFHMAAAELLASLRIPLNDTTRDVSSLTGGQRQPGAGARALGRKARLLALERRAAPLGTKEAAQVEELIMGLQQQGTTILLACHD